LALKITSRVTKGSPSPVFWTDRTALCEPTDHGVDIAPHYHHFGQLRYTASGALITVTQAGTWVAPANRITWVPPFHVHSGRIYGGTDVRLLQVPVTVVEQLPPEPSVFVASALMRAAYLEVVDGEEPLDSPRTRLLLDVIAVELARAPEESLRLPEPNDARLKAVATLLQADPANSATLADLGRRTGSSERTLSRLFSSELSMSFHQWRTLLRIQRALLELGEGTSVTDTAIRLGWANPSSFITAFTELVGQTPGHYRSKPGPGTS
jgi:AraC-like DNA-binding protein